MFLTRTEYDGSVACSNWAKVYYSELINSILDAYRKEAENNNLYGLTNSRGSVFFFLSMTVESHLDHSITWHGSLVFELQADGYCCLSLFLYCTYHLVAIIVELYFAGVGDGGVVICNSKEQAVFYLSGADNVGLANPHMISDAVNILLAQPANYAEPGNEVVISASILFQQPNSICFFLANFNKMWNYVQSTRKHDMVLNYEVR
ncbi:hypothetical protein C5167_020468 [Papaver somniferum]|uniref:Uncharacterized protein n=1 Tax=Papaver somniferum TaxID=3469 RepID=A0A4Y7IX18_PAPSO|nr:hypothetical protein C5167_020468 [Papaver somniferum]